MKMPIPTRSASLREPRKQTSNIARPTTKAPTPTAGPGNGPIRQTNDKHCPPLNPSPVEGGLTARGRTLLPQRSNPAQDTGRVMGQTRLQPPSSRLKPRGDPSPTRQQEVPLARKQTHLKSTVTMTGTAHGRRQSLMQPVTLKNPAAKTTGHLSKTSAPSFTPPSPRKQLGRRSPLQPPPIRRPASPKKEMLPPPRPTRSSSLRQPVGGGKGPPTAVRVHTRHKSQLVQNTKQTEPTPATGLRPRLLSTYQRPSSPKKFSKPPTPTPETVPKPGNLLIPSSWPDIAALQTELLQLNLFRFNSLQKHADWKSDYESHLRKKYDGIAGQYRTVLADETRRQCQLNAQALGLWLSTCREHHGPDDFSEQIQTLSQILEDISGMIAGGLGGQYYQVVNIFEDWIVQAECIRHNRGPGGMNIGVFVDPLARSWKELLHAVNAKLELYARQLQALDILSLGQVELLGQSALVRVARNLTDLIQLMSQEVRAMQTLEAEVVRSERVSISCLAMRLAGSMGEMRAPRIGAWRS